MTRHEWEARRQVARSMLAIVAACEIKPGGESMPQILAAHHDPGDEDGTPLWPLWQDPDRRHAMEVTP